MNSGIYCGPGDLSDILDLLMLGRSKTGDWHYAHVGELLFNFFMVACHLDPSEHVRLWHNDAGQLVAYAILSEDPSFDCQVLPEYEWSGIEAEAFVWAETFLSELRHRDAARWCSNLVSGSRQDDLPRIAFLEQRGFRYHGRFAEVNMLRPLSVPIPSLDTPSGYRLCSLAGLDDVPSRAAAQREVWQPWTVGNVTTADYSYMMQLPGYHADLDVVTLAPDGAIAAYVNGWIDPVNHIGDFGPVGALPAYRRKGLTRLTMLESLRRMQAYGMDRVCISTGIVNTPALNLYTSLGFQVVNHYLDYVKIV